MSTLAESLAAALIDNRQALITAIVESCPVPMFVTDREGHWVHVNIHYQKLLGHAQELLLGDGWMSTVVEEQRVSLTDFWHRIIGNKVGVNHLQLVHTQGHAHNGRVIGFMNVGYVNAAGFVGWFVPICATPGDCPLHGFILGNTKFKGFPTIQGPIAPCGPDCGV